LLEPKIDTETLHAFHVVTFILLNVAKCYRFVLPNKNVGGNQTKFSSYMCGEKTLETKSFSKTAMVVKLRQLTGNFQCKWDDIENCA
jgi:hypothetical protein